MQEYINVDIYGQCGNLTCHQEDCFEKLSKEYKFYVAFENAICPDYVTEKFFRTMKLPLIPIVMGGDNYRQLAPPGSFIDVNNFRSVRALTEYLLYLDQNTVRFYPQLDQL